MKRFLLFLLLPISAFAQQGGVFIPPRVVTGTVNGITRPIAGATVTVCAANTAGIPCSPVLVNTVFKDQGLTVPLSNPFITDANGNYPQAALAGGTYTITESAPGFTGFSYQATVACAPGAGCTVTPLASQSIGAVLYVGPGGYSTIGAANTALGSNPGTVIIQSNYTGIDCPPSAASANNKAVFLDYRSNSSVSDTFGNGVCTGNVISYTNTDASPVQSTVRTITTRNTYPGSTTGAYNQCFFNGGAAPSSNTLECGTTETDLLGSWTSIPSTTSFIGHEVDLIVESTGQTINNAYSGFFGLGARAPATTNITNAYDLRATAITNGGTGTIANAIGALFNRQTIGTTTNLSMQVDGTALFDDSSANEQNIRITGDATANNNMLRETNTHTGGGDYYVGEAGTAGNFGFRNLNVSGGPVWEFNFAGTGNNIGTISHANTGNRTYKFPDLTGGTPVVFSCGNTGSGNQTCAPAAASTKTQIYNGESTLAANAATITFPNAFTSATSFFCVANDVTTRANPVQMVPASTTTATITNTTGATDVIQWLCIGN